jgi:hypothetical protein
MTALSGVNWPGGHGGVAARGVGHNKTAAVSAYLNNRADGGAEPAEMWLVAYGAGLRKRLASCNEQTRWRSGGSVKRQRHPENVETDVPLDTSERIGRGRNR